MPKNKTHTHINKLINHIMVRIPGGFLWHDFASSFTYYKYGKKLGLKQTLRVVAIFFIGTKNIGKQRVIAQLTEPYPTMYHYTETENLESILKKGLLPNGGRAGGFDSVYMTNNTNLGKRLLVSGKTCCLQINTSHLISLGHKINILNDVNEFTTDYVPAECLKHIEN